MSEFNRLEKELRSAFADRRDLSLEVSRPKSTEGLSFLTLVREDGFVVEVEWHRHRGFGIVAGSELVFGSGVDEVYATAAAAFERVTQLIETGVETSGAATVELGELRRLCGFLQKDVALELGISKSGLAQMERPASLESMQIVTLRRLIASLGGELVIKARFPEGRERRIAVD